MVVDMLGAADVIEDLVRGRQRPVFDYTADMTMLFNIQGLAANLLAGLFESVLHRQPTDFFPGGSATLPEPIN